MRRYTQAIMLALIVSLASCTESQPGKQHTEHPGDTLYTAKNAMYLMAREPERALQIIDSAEIVGNVPDFEADFLRAKVYSQSTEWICLDSAIIIGERLMQHDSIKNSLEWRQNTLEVLTSACRMRSDYDRWMDWATELETVCQEQGAQTEALRTRAEIGLIQTKLGNREVGLRMIDEVIRQLDGIRRFNELDAAIIAMKRKINALNDADRLQEIIPVAQHIIDRLADYEQNPQVYKDGTYREPPETHRAGYIDFYRAQARGYITRAYTFSGDLKKGRENLALFDQSDYSRTLSGRRLIVLALCDLGEYRRATAICDEVEDQIGTDTLNAIFVNLLKTRARIADATGRRESAGYYWQRYAQLNQQLNDSILAGKGQLYAARYHAQEQQQKIAEEHARARLTLIVCCALGILTLLVLCFTFFAVRLRHRTERKNRILIRQIAEAVKYKDKFHELEKTIQEQALNTAEEADTVPVEPESLDSLSDEELFAYLSEVIRREQLFLDPSCGRQTLIDRFHINERRIGSAFAKGSSHTSLPDFVRDLRLEHACRLLASRPDLSIGEVASASGFSSLTVFGREFKKKLDVTPTLYRAQMQASE